MKILHTHLGNGSITDWQSLGAVLVVKPQILAWTLKTRNNMQFRKEIKGRTVYASARPLRFVQVRIEALLSGLLDTMPDNEVVLSYRPGISPVTKLKSYAGSERLISFDIRHFYDNVRLWHIEETLVEYGFTPQGGRLIGRYCIVKRGDKGQSLQQGCPASPVISNLVGYKYIDRPILAWLRKNWPNLKYDYVRYCDNVELFLREETTKEFYDAYREFVCGELRKSGFKTHDWASIGQHDRHRNMRFLGVVLNKVARVEKEKIDSLRAALFNMVKQTDKVYVRRELDRFMETHGIAVNAHEVFTPVIKAIKGYISYITPINKKHATWLKKLVGILIFWSEYEGQKFRVIGWPTHVMSYKDNNESVEEYVTRLKTLCLQQQVLDEDTLLT